MESNVKIIVPSESVGTRIDKFLSLNSELSRTRIANLIDSGCVSENDTIVTDISKKVKAGEEYYIKLPPLRSLTLETADIPLDIIYEDKDLIVINKPAGLVVHPATGNYDNTLVNALLYHCKDLSGIGGVERPGIVHRLDKDTSGLMVVAKNDATHLSLSSQFAEHQVEKLYQAVVFGTFNPRQGTIKGNIGRSPNNRQKMAILKDSGKPATTHYRTLETYFDGAISLVECSLETGRTHQIRVHLSQSNHSLIGDALYGGKNKSLKSTLTPAAREAINNFPRQALHAYQLSFTHPMSKEKLSFQISLSEDIQNLLKILQIE